MNAVYLVGRLGKDPETRFTPTGAKVTSFSFACNGRKGKTVWWKVTLWGEQYDKMLAHVKKGSALIIQGELNEPQTYTDREGKVQVSLEVTANHLAFVPGKAEGPASEGGKQSQQGFEEAGFDFEPVMQGSNHSAFDEEIPF